MNWGKGIIIVCSLFVLGIGVMVYTSVTKNIDLVTKNYYDEELKYQQRINKLNNSDKLNEKVTFDVTENAIIISYPKSAVNVNGEVTFYRPSDEKKDFKLPVELNSESKQVILTDKLQKGFWKVQVNWNSGDVGYYNEEKVIIQ